MNTAQILQFPVAVKSITVRLTKVYGNEAIYPVCADAQTFADMLGTKTLTRNAIASIKALGYSIEVKADAVTL